MSRDAALKKAEKLLRQGKLEGAIQEYVRLLEANPRDWNSMNALGDLYARAGDASRAVEQYTRIADYLYGEGFFQKAAALYKKALKTQADHEPSLLRLAEIATAQGLVADARLYWSQVAKVRRGRGDERGAGECLIALGVLPDAALKLGAGRASQALGETRRAAEFFQEAAALFEKQGRSGDALDALVAAAQADEGDAELRARVVRRCVAAGDDDRARQFLSSETAGEDPDLLLALGKLELAGARHQEARQAFSRLLVGAPERSGDVLQVSAEIAASGNLEAAFECADVVAETALLGGDFEGAIRALESVLGHGAYVPALMKLVEVAVDAGRDALMTSAQERLADAYLDAGRGAEARVVAEDLVARDPRRAENVDRLRRALLQVGSQNVEDIIARLADPPAQRDDTLPELELPASDMDFELLEVEIAAEPDDEQAAATAPAAGPLDQEIPIGSEAAPEEIARDDRPPSTAPPPAVAPADPADVEHPLPGAPPSRGATNAAINVEVDLSDMLAQLEHDSAVFAPPPAARVEESEPAGSHARPAPADVPDVAPPAEDLDAVFTRMRTRVRAHEGTAPAAQLDRGLQLLEQGRVEEAVADLEAAARAPMLRFRAASTLGRFYATRGQLDAAVDWLERAADAPVPSEEESLAVLYELADTLDRMGERARALAILLEIDADRSAYRDVPQRIEQLTRAQTGSRGR